MRQISSENPSILLASGSPRRLDLTRRIGFDPVVRVSSIVEERAQEESPESYARRLALEKAQDVADQFSSDTTLPGWILSADTIVVHDHQVLEKPTDEDDAVRMLQKLSGSRHEVITAFCWLWRAPGAEPSERIHRVRAVTAEVWLRDLTPEMIERYVATGEPMDKAGSYGIQDIGGVLVRKVVGSYFCVVGLPVCEVIEELQELSGLKDYPFLAQSRDN